MKPGSCLFYMLPDLSHYSFFAFALSMVGVLGLLWLVYDINERKRRKQEVALKSTLTEQKSTITHQKLEQLRLQKQAVHDPHTGAYNREVLMEMFELEVIRSKRYQRPCSIMLVEVEHFDVLNKNYGFEATNKVVADLVKHCRAQLRPYDIIGRTAGNQFMLMLVEADPSGCPRIAERLHASIGQSPVEHEGTRIGYSTAIAWSSLDKHHEDSHKLFDDCCKSLQSKQSH